MHSIIVFLCSTTYVQYFHWNRNSSCGLHKGEWPSPLRNAYSRLICLRLYANVHRSNFNFIIFIKNNLTAQEMRGREFGVKNWPRVDSSYGLCNVPPAIWRTVFAGVVWLTVVIFERRCRVRLYNLGNQSLLENENSWWECILERMQSKMKWRSGDFDK